MLSPDVERWAAATLADFDPRREPPPLPVAPAGSERKLHRLTLPGRAVILVENPSPPGDGPNENDSFAYLSGHLAASGLPVPAVHAYSRELGASIIDDLGDDDLYLAIRGQASPEKSVELYREALSLLVRMQTDALKSFDPGRCLAPTPYGRELMLTWESGYFHRELVEGALGLEPPSGELRREYESLADEAAGAGAGFFMHRDFQSQNLKLWKDRLWIIDFQGARLGPAQYDVASLLYDPYTDLDDEMREELLAHYLGLFLPRTALDGRAFLDAFPAIALHRLMQALGAYAFLGLRRRKEAFLSHVPTALRLLDGLCRRLPPERCPTFIRLVARARELWPGRV